MMILAAAQTLKLGHAQMIFPSHEWKGIQCRLGEMITRSARQCQSKMIYHFEIEKSLSALGPYQYYLERYRGRILTASFALLVSHIIISQYYATCHKPYL